MSTETSQKLAIVTGGAGFIGSHLCERLVQEGYRVISLDNYFTGSKDNHVAGVEYREGHTKDIATLVPEDPDIIYHLGEYSRVEQSVLEPGVVHDYNVLGTEGVMSFWREKKCKLVYAGSSTKFGDGGKARETSPYAQTKAHNSEQVRDIGEREHLPYAITYFYNVYGPRERSGMYGTVIEHFKRIYLSGAPCPIVAPGTQERNFTHVLDIVDGLFVVGESGAGDEYGLGNKDAYSIRAVADLFMCSESSVLFPPREGNRMTSELDTKKAEALGWSASRSLVDYVSHFTASHARGTKKDARVLVFSTTFAPVSGPVEDAFIELAEALPSVSFDVITTYCSQPHATESLPKNVTVHRVGFGNSFDKFLLPFLGAYRARTLARTHSYLFTWALMASYAGLASFFAKNMVRIPVLITLGDQSVHELPWYKRAVLSRMISRADQVYGSHSEQEQSVSHALKKKLPRYSMGEGDAFVNALRFAYADIIRHRTSA